MAGKRFDYVGDEPAPQAPAGPSTPAPVAPAAPATASGVLPPPASLARRERRDNLGVRVYPSLKAHLDSLVLDMRQAGWEVSQYHIVEYWLESLTDPETRAALIRGIAQRETK